ncbi:unnamed protein product [Brassica oleracea var. botrytis]
MKSVSKQELGFMRRIMTTDATTTKKLGTGAVRISNEERMKKETSCAMWRRSDGGLSMWNWRGRSKASFDLNHHPYLWWSTCHTQLLDPQQYSL